MENSHFSCNTPGYLLPPNINDFCLTTEYGAIIQNIDIISQDDKIFLEKRMYNTQFQPKYELLPIRQGPG